MRLTILALTLLFFSLTCVGCGGGSGGGSAQVAINLLPATASLNPGGTQGFTASVTNTTNTAVTWRVQEGARGGTIAANGTYTAPTTAGTYHVVATSQADTTKSATSTVTVNIQVKVEPTSATTTLGTTRPFTATVLGTTNQAVTWSIQEGAGGGTISAGGVYTPPVTPGTYHVVATSQADTTRSGSATVTVQAGSATGVIQ